MAKDTEKLIRQLSLISYLMAERRPVTALEIRRDVEGYSGMNEDAFARRFYADRSELESLRIQLTVDRPADGAAEQENYSLRPENFHLPAIEFSDEELAALQAALRDTDDGGHERLQITGFLDLQGDAAIPPDRPQHHRPHDHGQNQRSEQHEWNADGVRLPPVFNPAHDPPRFQINSATTG